MAYKGSSTWKTIFFTTKKKVDYPVYFMNINQEKLYH
jgi:hypothetical protein